MVKAPRPVTRLDDPWLPVETSVLEAQAIKALAQGEANQDQQLLVVGWLTRATGSTELEFRPDSERASAFASGKRFVAMQFNAAIYMPLPREK